jgi:hypothetical protein
VVGLRVGRKNAGDASNPFILNLRVSLCIFVIILDVCALIIQRTVSF